MDVKVGLGLRRGRREKYVVFISKFDSTVLDTYRGKMGLYI